MLTVKAGAMATLGIKKHTAEGDGKRETDIRCYGHTVCKVHRNTKSKLTKEITTEQKHANPLIAREAIYNHLIISSAFLRSCTLRFFCFVKLSLSYKWHLKKHTVTPTWTSTWWAGCTKRTYTHPHTAWLISAHYLNICVCICVWISLSLGCDPANHLQSASPFTLTE